MVGTGGAMAAKKPAAKVKKPKKNVAKTILKKIPVKAKAVPKAKVQVAVPVKSTGKPKAAARPPEKPVKAPTPTQKAQSPSKPEPPVKAQVKAPAKPSSVSQLMPSSKSISRTSDLNTASAANADDDNEGAENGGANLLAGPRNVQPYIPKRGEQYMSKEQLGHFENILFSWKRDLMEEVDRTVLHMKDEAANFPDPNDRATQESEFSLELRTRDRERKLIRKIDEALKRIEDGTYGYCNETGEEIGIKRLEARPVATLSVEAQERRERREKQYGDRDDRYR
jgi:DnaK suppressor protein